MEHVEPTYPVRGSIRSLGLPLSGLRVSWGAVLAGAVATLAVTLILMALALAIILTASNANMGSLRGGLIAAWMCAMALTIVGAFVGGIFAGYLPGNPRRVIAGAHAFLSWSVAFVFVSLLGFGMLGRTLRTSAMMTAQTANAAAETATGATAGVMPLDRRVMNLLESLGMPAPQAQATVHEAQTSVRESFAMPAPGAVRGEVRGALNTFIDWTAGLTWAFFGTWAIAALGSVLGGLLGVSRLRRRSVQGGVGEVTVEPTAGGYVQVPQPG